MYCYECVESPPRFAHPLNPLPLLLLAGGRLFDPVGFSRGDEAMYKKYKQNEITNGRLAMVANLGFWAQYAATGKGPIENLQVGVDA